MSETLLREQRWINCNQQGISRLRLQWLGSGILQGLEDQLCVVVLKSRAIIGRLPDPLPSSDFSLTTDDEY
jgi:hypothetical protein